MLNEKYRQRLDELFAKIEHLEADPQSHTASIRCELEEIRARLTELEASFLEAQKHDTPNEATENAPIRRAVPILYETEQMGYAFADDRVQTIHQLGFDLQTKEEMILAPLTAGEEPIGLIQLKPSTKRQWTAEEMQLANIVAQQASLQIQNLRLLDATERARAEAEAATRRFLHESWDSFLDAIHQSERVGYTYDQSSVKPLPTTFPFNGGVLQEVKVMDEHIGTLYLEPDPSQTLTGEDQELIASIADQVSQQLENIRLLADATRARAESEEATRRLTREGWQSYARVQDRSQLAFVYDTNRVTPLAESTVEDEIDFVQPLTVRGEPIGELAMAGRKDLSPEDADLTAAIANQVSVQLEAMRLTEELQRRAYELATVATVSTSVSTLRDPDQLLQSVADETKERFGLYHVHIYLVDETFKTLLLAAGAGEVGRQMLAEGWNISIDHPNSIVAEVARNRKYAIVNNLVHDQNSTFLSNRLLPDTRSEMAVPLIVGEKLLGVFDVQSDVAGRFTDDDANIYTTLAAQVGVALQNARLYVEQAATVTQLRELDRLKSAFLANMSHELRTPLNSILGFSDVILEELDGPTTDLMQNDLQLIQKNGRHLLHLINDVLDMAKIDAGRMNLHPENFRLHELFEEVIGITSSLAAEKSLSVHLSSNSGNQELAIFADRTRIQQVMINLVNNAIKFTEKGEISIHANEPQNGHVVISVRDTGLGVPADHLESIFQEFTQVDTSTTRKVGGTGLGLPISRRLIQLHGGRLWAESTGIPGEGSIFYIELPIEAKLAEPIEKQER